jgi:hypothetical protein
MPDYSVEQELVQGGEGSLTFLEPRFWPTSELPTIRPEHAEGDRQVRTLRALRLSTSWNL